MLLVIKHRMVDKWCRSFFNLCKSLLKQGQFFLFPLFYNLFYFFNLKIMGRDSHCWWHNITLLREIPITVEENDWQNWFDQPLFKLIIINLILHSVVVQLNKDFDEPNQKYIIVARSTFFSIFFVAKYDITL